MRHVGKISNTGQRCVVVMMQIPGREDHALVATTDNLPPKVEQAVMEVLQSKEGQSEEVLYNVLGRRAMPDGGRTVLQTLHDMNYLSAVPVANVAMYPTPGQSIPLDNLLLQMGRAIPGQTVSANPLDTRLNQHQVNITSENSDQRRQIAANLLLEARDMEFAASQKRELAYQHDPDQRPADPKVHSVDLKGITKANAKVLTEDVKDAVAKTKAPKPPVVKAPKAASAKPTTKTLKPKTDKA